MSTTRRTVTPVRPAHESADQYIRQQDTCTPWGLHYNAYQDTYRPVPPRPTTRKPPRKLRTTSR